MVVFYDIGLVIIAATLVAIIIRLLKQPIILGYIVAGILIGPSIFGLIKEPASIISLSELGVAFLLFIIGMELNLKRLRTFGLTASVIGAIQVAAVTVLGFLVSLLVLPPLEAVYIGLIASFSSTMIVVKLLSDKDELDSLHGELVLGILIIQDVLAVLAISMLTTINNFSFPVVGMILLKGFALFSAIFLFSMFVLPRILKLIVHSQDLLFVGALTICFIFAAVAILLGYSIAIGAFMAGIALGTTNYRYEISAKVKPLRDFFLIIFFVALGTQLHFGNFFYALPVFGILLFATIVLKPLVTFFIVRAFKYGNRASFFSGIQIAQVGEFSLILAAQGVLLKQVSDTTFSAIASATILTFVLTAYAIKYDENIYQLFARRQKNILSDKEKELRSVPNKLSNHIVVFGMHRMADKIIKALAAQKKPFIVVDYNPEKARELISKKMNIICSDMSNHEVYEELGIDRAKAIVSTVHNLEGNAMMIRKVREMKKDALIIVTTRSSEDAISLYKAGADYVILPEYLGGEKVVNYMEHLTHEGVRSWGKKHYEGLVGGGEE